MYTETHGGKPDKPVIPENLFIHVHVHDDHVHTCVHVYTMYMYVHCTDSRILHTRLPTCQVLGDHDSISSELQQLLSSGQNLGSLQEIK